MWHLASSRLVIGNKMHQNWNVTAKQSSTVWFQTRRDFKHFFFLMFSCSPVVTLRSTKNWVHIPLKEISDANKLFCARCSGYRVAPKTKLCVTLLPSTKFVFLLPGRHGALQGCLSRFYAGVWTGAARKTRGHRGGPEKLQDWAWVRSLWTIQLESQSAAFFLLGYNKHALSVVLGLFFF